MDFLGLERKGGRILDQQRIELRAALHLRQADAGARNGQIFVAQEIAQARVGGVDLAGLGFVGGGEPGLVGLADAFGEALHRPHEHRIHERGVDLGIELGDHDLDSQPGLYHAARHAFAELGDRAVDKGDVVIVALQIVLVIGEGLERRDALAAGKVGIECVYPEEVVERAHLGQLADPVARTGKRTLLGIFEHVIGEAVGGRELGAVDLRQQREIELGIGACGDEGSVGERIAERVGIAIIAAEQAAERIERQFACIGVLEQRKQLVMLGLGGGRGCGGGRSSGLGKCGCSNKQQRARSGKNKAKFHG